MDWTSGFTFLFKDIAQGNKNSLYLSVGLGIAERDFFSAGANLSFLPSTSLLSLVTTIDMRSDGERLSSSIGVGLGPSLQFIEKVKPFLTFTSHARFSTFITPGRVAMFFQPIFSGYLGKGGGFSLILSAGVTLMTPP